MGGMVVTDDPHLAAQLQAFQATCAWPSVALTTGYVLKLVLSHILGEPHIHRYARAMYNRLGRRHPLPKAVAGDEMRGARPARYEQRLSNAQAALCLRQLRRLDGNLAHRRAVADAYRVLLSERGFRPPEPPPKAGAAYVRYPVWVEDRAAAVRSAAPCALLGTWFTSVLEEARTPAHGGYAMGSCPRAEAAARHLVNLPTHPRVGAQDVEAIVAALAQAAPDVRPPAPRPGGPRVRSGAAQDAASVARSGARYAHDDRVR
jgi:dTDP-4-amino-4,6-dideoxygalactose transaminase